MFVEHVNVTVTDPETSAAILSRIFDWHIRWEGPSLLGGRSVHVGSGESYLALYTSGDPDVSETEDTAVGLNHIGIVVDDLDEIERRVLAEGYVPNAHMTYEPGRRFYFDDRDGIEFEVVSYGR